MATKDGIVYAYVAPFYDQPQAAEDVEHLGGFKHELAGEMLLSIVPPISIVVVVVYVVLISSSYLVVLLCGLSISREVCQVIRCNICVFFLSQLAYLELLFWFQ